MYVAATVLIVCISIALIATCKWNKDNNNNISIKEQIKCNIAEFKRILKK